MDSGVLVSGRLISSPYRRTLVSVPTFPPTASSPLIPRSWWLAPGLLVSPFPAHPDQAQAAAFRQALTAAGISLFIDLTEPGERGRHGPLPDYTEGWPEPKPIRVRLPVPDVTVPSQEVIRVALGWIAWARQQGRGVCLHCLGGRGRSATIAGAWLRTQGLSGPEALAAITAARAGDPAIAHIQAPETAAQRAAVAAWPGETRARLDDASPSDRYRGALVGLAVGDCLGAPVEFSRPGSFEPVTGLRAGGPFNLKVGEWTDDTSMALCLAESLVEQDGKVVSQDMLARWLRWFRKGHLSSTGRCFDIGTATRQALLRFEKQPADECGAPDAAGNGTIMRLAPIPMAFAWASPDEIMQAAATSSRTTHGAREATDAAMMLALLIADALRGELDRDTLTPRAVRPGHARFHELHQNVQSVFEGSWRTKVPPEIKAGGYVVDTLEAALWAFGRTATFRDGALLAVNLGDDADTVGAVYGQLAGAYYGAEAIPFEWRKPILQRELIESFADKLLGIAQLRSRNKGST
jgi:ADP-ribosyl-[dinitrogen reductase] hydrolase